MIRFLNIIFTSCLFFISLCFSSAAMAENAIGYLNKDERNCKNIEKIQKEIETYKKIPISDVSNKKELETIKENFIKQLQGIINTCNDAKKSFPNAMQNLAIQDNNLENDRILLIFSTTSADERDAIYSENFQNQLNNFSENASSQATRDKASQILNNYNTYNEAVEEINLMLHFSKVAEKLAALISLMDAQPDRNVFRKMLITLAFEEASLLFL